MPSSERRIWIVRGEEGDADGDYQCKAADVKCCCFNFRTLFFARRIENHREHHKPTAIRQQRQQVEGGSDSSFRTSEVRSITEMDSAADHSNRISEVSRRRPLRIPMETTAGGVLQAYPTTTDHYSRQDPHFHQNHHLQAYHHHPYYYNTMHSYPHRSSSSSQLTPQFYNSYLQNQNNQLFLHGNLGGSSSSVMDAGTNYSYNNGGRSSSGSYSGRGYSGNFLQLPGSTAEDPLPMVKVDYDYNNFPNQTYAGCIW